MNERTYAGVGSRRTPEHVLSLMTDLAERLSQENYHLHTGHAPGADQAFELGAQQYATVFLPWRGFERDTPLLTPHSMLRPHNRAFDIAAEHHPAWDRLSRGARALHARNSHQVLGPDLNRPVDFVVCWSNGTGGTEQALRLATAYDVPIRNLYDDSVLASARSFVY